MGDCDTWHKVKGSEQMVKLVIQQIGFWIGVRFAGALVAEMAVQGLSMLLIIDKSSLEWTEYVYQSVTAQKSVFFCGGWKQNNQLSIVDNRSEEEEEALLLL